MERILAGLFHVGVKVFMLSLDSLLALTSEGGIKAFNILMIQHISSHVIHSFLYIEFQSSPSQ